MSIMNIFILLEKSMRFVIRWIYTFDMPKVKYKNLDESIKFIIENNLSIIRWGDGETNLFDGYDICYQDFDIKLKNEMLEIISSYSIESKYIIGLPVKFLDMNGIKSILNRKCRKFWMRTRKVYKQYFKHDQYYINAFIFGKGLEERYRNLWNSKDYCIFVHNNEMYATEFSEKYGIKTFFVKVIDNNAYSFIDEYENSIISIYYKNQLNSENTCILISAGPAAKALVFRLTKRNIVSYDTGHCWDYPLTPELSSE